MQIPIQPARLHERIPKVTKITKKWKIICRGNIREVGNALTLGSNCYVQATFQAEVPNKSLSPGQSENKYYAWNLMKEGRCFTKCDTM